MGKKSLTYAASGVKYGDGLDHFKVQAQDAARATLKNMRRVVQKYGGGEDELSQYRCGNFRFLEETMGESAPLVHADLSAANLISLVVEGLGTKNLVADAMYRLTGQSFYANISEDAVAMIVNDMITSGVLPQILMMHLAVGESGWFEDDRRQGDLIDGWKHACDLSQAAWIGGETPVLKDVIVPGTFELSGAGFGIASPHNRIDPNRIEAGDAILVFPSSGIHANGLSMARKIAKGQAPWWARRLPSRWDWSFCSKMKGYLQPLDDGRTFGEALLDPTVIYVDLVRRCSRFIKYAINITGHGWRKLMRAERPFAYVIDKLPEPHPVFRFMQAHGPVDDRNAYETFNMGGGFALIVAANDVAEVLRIAADCKPVPYMGFEAGYVEASAARQVVLRPKGITFEAETLQIR